MNAIGSFLNSKKVAPYVFLAPFMILFIIFKIWPAVVAVDMSFQDAQGVRSENWTWVGLDNYTSVIGNERFQDAMRVTTLYTVGTLLVLVPIPLILAAMLDSGRVFKSTGFRVILFLPALTSLVVAGTIFRVLLSRTGVVNSVLDSIWGVEPQRWLEVADLALPSLIIIAFWRWTGINIIYFNSGLVNIPRELYEAAAIDGANGVQIFFRITLPMLKPITFFVTILTIIGGYQVFVEPYILWTAGNSPGNSGLTVALHLYRTAFQMFDLGRCGDGRHPGADHLCRFAGPVPVLRCP